MQPLVPVSLRNELIVSVYAPATAIESVEAMRIGAAWLTWAIRPIGIPPHEPTERVTAVEAV